MKRSTWHQLFFCGIAVGFGMTEAIAQPVYGTDYITFKGYGKVLDNPPNATCQSFGIGFGTRFTVTYRFTANSALVSDAITFLSENHSIYRIASTSASRSLNGASTTDWTWINRFSNFGSGSASTILTIQSGINGPVSLGTGNMKITNGQINDFYGPGCNITNFHAAAVVIPN